MHSGENPSIAPRIFLQRSIVECREVNPVGYRVQRYGITSKEAPQAHAQEEAPQDAQAHASSAPARQVVRHLHPNTVACGALHTAPPSQVDAVARLLCLRAAPLRGRASYHHLFAGKGPFDEPCRAATGESGACARMFRQPISPLR